MKRLQKVLLRNVFLCLFVFTQKFLRCFATMETKISVDCHSDPQHIMVKVTTSIPFEGLIYVSERYGDLDCTAFGKKNETTFLKVPLKGCNTHEDSKMKTSIILMEDTINGHKVHGNKLYHPTQILVRIHCAVNNNQTSLTS
ncbi:ZP domain-containing protein [Nephila pilipes]|uniref:ZP domain-containing protein n=1 Tax=Nephila pilipes TaxID=299642 RepID=A0A8X6QWP6_NEPPI|nr:ZP domain-containing protein [Nephila pilipes]